MSNPTLNIKVFPPEWVYWKGSCFGFAISTFMAFDNKSTFLGEFPGVGDFINLYDLSINDERRKCINQLGIYQFGDEQLDHIDENKDISPNITLNQIKNMLSNDERNDQILMFFNQNGSGAHAVNPVKVRRDKTNPDIENIIVYDNNWPGNEMEISINKKTNTWDYWIMSKWGGEKGLFLMDPIDNYYGTPTLSKNITEKDRYISSKSNKYIKFFNSTNCEINITNDSGENIGYSDSVALNNLVEGIPIIPISGKFSPPIGYYIPDREYDIKMENFIDSLAYFSVLKDSISFVCERMSAKNNQVDYFGYKGNCLSVKSLDQYEKKIKIETLIEKTDEFRTFILTNYQLNENDSSLFEVVSTDILKIINYGGQKLYNLKLKYLSNNMDLTFEYEQIALEANSSHFISPFWDDIDNQPVTIFIDNDNDGSVDDSINVKNQYTGIQIGQNIDNIIPKDYYLSQNYPNPFNNSTRIRFGLTRAENVKIGLFNINGQKISSIISQRMKAGNHEVTFNGKNLSSGIYFYQIKAGSFTQTKKMVLIK